MSGTETGKLAAYEGPYVSLSGVQNEGEGEKLKGFN